jgi:homoserine dehydrogenase
VAARVALAGLGTVGSWLLSAIERGEAGDVEVVATTTGRDGREGALDEEEFDVLAEVVNSPPGGEPGATFIRRALSRGVHVATSDKWPVALHGVEFASAARERGVGFRAESTVMSGTPVLSPLAEALTGASPVSARGIVNATVNVVLSEMAGGASYEDALAAAQSEGLAEPDPRADVDGRDECAKAMVLAALVFGVQLSADAVTVRGISALSVAEREAIRDGRNLRSITTLTRAPDGAVRASVEPRILEPRDLLSGVEGVENALSVLTEAGEELEFRGPGAGLEIAGLGVLDDLRAIVGAGGRRGGPPPRAT